MNNPIISQLAQKLQPQNLGKIRQIINLMRSAGNPEAMLQSMVSQNPQMKEVINLIGNRDPKQVFYSLCKQRNIDPDSIFDLLEQK